MPAAMTLKAIATGAVLIQFGIFLYLYVADPHRVRFFRYLLWAWGCVVVVRVADLTHALAPGFAGSLPLMHAASSAGALGILAAGLAYRRAYRLRWHHAGLGIAVVVASALWGASGDEGLAGWPWRATVGGGLLIAGGLAFWPPRSVYLASLGNRLLAIALVLWGLHRVVLPFLLPSLGPGSFMAADVTAIVCYFLTVCATTMLVKDHANARMAALQDFTERLVDGLGEGLVLVDGAFTLRYANPWIARQFGSVVGRYCYEVLTANSQPCPGCPLAYRHQMDTPVRLDIDGPETRRLRLTCSPVRQPDDQIFLLELVADVTEQERLRTRLLEAEHLAAAGEVAAGMAHEIRNPLSALVNAATLLEREALLSREERASILDAVKIEARRLNATLSGFLAFARPQEPRRVVGDLRDVVRHVATLLGEECAQAGGVQVEVHVEPGVPRVAFDPDQLTQVLWNIALNAVEAMAGHGGLRFEVGWQDRAVWIAVADTGPGIPPEEQRRIFQPFVSQRQGGTGLGLAIARRIVMAHAGQIELESAPGQGSRFIIRLPLEEE